MTKIRFVLNGRNVVVDVDPGVTLLKLLRDQLHLTGTKLSCGRGECGACTVLLNGKAVNSCLLYAIKADGTIITTIEGLGSNGDLHPLQKAFIDNAAVQCGFCTPGMILTAKSFLDDNNDPTKEEVARAISGNMCRCGGYRNEVKAILAAAKVMKNKKNDMRAKVPAQRRRVNR